MADQHGTREVAEPRPDAGWAESSPSPAGTGMRGDAAPARLQVRPGVRVPQLLAGAGLVVASVLAFVLVAAREDDGARVWVLVRAVPAGQVLTPGDLVSVKVRAGAGAGLVPAADPGEVVGHTLRVPAVAGQILAAGMIGPGSWPPAGQSVASVVLGPGRVPAGLMPGSRVQVVIRPAARTAAEAAPAEASLVAASVVQVQPLPSTGGSVVSVLVSSADAVTIAGLNGDRAGLMLLGSQG